MKSYKELSILSTFDDRLRYLKLDGIVGDDTFGSKRYLNQTFYKQNPKWKKSRSDVVIRDCGCDLGIKGLEIHGAIIVHHINPITLEDILEDRDILYDPENLITVSFMTHQAIHYGSELLTETIHYTPRTPNDTCPWKKGQE